jgi:hypothetical protein
MNSKPEGYSVSCCLGRRRGGKITALRYDMLINKTLGECLAFARARGFTAHHTTIKMLQQVPHLPKELAGDTYWLGVRRGTLKSFPRAEAGITYTHGRS